ncbi:lipopolysaccharide biosynthesis protein [Bradyrhizobium sp. LMG 9283]|uniref:lipopolysaccharide biosynthesis protein n=1 Tax=Bradyrhizobium sp. LMG 9283 TaxID=592064 RepID=UPI003890000E
MSAKNELTTSMASGERSRAISIYQSTFALLSLVVALVLAILLAAVSPSGLNRAFTLGEISGENAKLVLLFLAGNVLLNQYLLLFAAGLRACGRPAEEVIWNASSRLAEGIATVISATQSDDLSTTALAILMCRGCIAVLLWARLSAVAPWLQLGFTYVSLSEVRLLASPSFAFLAQSFAQVLLIQGPVVLLGTLASPLAITTFSTCRTLVRLGTTGANLLNATFIPEYTRLYATDRPLLWATFRWHSLATTFMVAGYIAVLLFFGEYILRLWTKDAVHTGYPWFFFMVVASSSEMMWTTLAMPMLAINRHITLSYAYLSVSIICLGGLAVALKSFGLDAVGMSLVTAHGAMLVVVALDVRRQFRQEIIRK